MRARYSGQGGPALVEMVLPVPGGETELCQLVNGWPWGFGAVLVGRSGRCVDCDAATMFGVGKEHEVVSEYEDGATRCADHARAWAERRWVACVLPEAD